MAPWPDLSRRSEQHERMDDLAIGGLELDGALRELRVINWLLGASGPTLEGVARLWRRAGRPRQLHILDVGAGSGDAARPLLAWADRRGVAMYITLVDINPATCAVAGRFYADEPRVRIAQGDLFALPHGAADIVTAALFVHHFGAGQLPAVLAQMRRAARIGVVVNDLHRHPLAWLGIWAATRLLSRNRMIRNDAPLSVCRGFRTDDWAQLRAHSGLSGLRAAWRPLFRWLVTLE